MLTRIEIVGIIPAQSSPVFHYSETDRLLVRILRVWSKVDMFLPVTFTIYAC